MDFDTDFFTEIEKASFKTYMIERIKSYEMELYLKIFTFVRDDELTVDIMNEVIDEIFSHFKERSLRQDVKIDTENDMVDKAREVMRRSRHKDRVAVNITHQIDAFKIEPNFSYKFLWSLSYEQLKVFYFHYIINLSLDDIAKIYKTEIENVTRLYIETARRIFRQLDKYVVFI